MKTKGCAPAYLTGPCSWQPERSTMGGLEMYLDLRGGFVN